NVLQLRKCDASERGSRFREVLPGGGQRARNRSERCNNLLASGGIKWRRRQQKLEICSHSLLDVKTGIALPVPDAIQFPAHARKRRPHQPVIDLAGDWPCGCVNFLPAHLVCRLLLEKKKQSRFISKTAVSRSS